MKTLAKTLLAGALSTALTLSSWAGGNLTPGENIRVVPEVTTPVNPALTDQPGGPSVTELGQTPAEVVADPSALIQRDAPQVQPVEAERLQAGVPAQAALPATVLPQAESGGDSRTVPVVHHEETPPAAVHHPVPAADSGNGQARAQDEEQGGTTTREARRTAQEIRDSPAMQAAVSGVAVRQEQGLEEVYSGNRLGNGRTATVPIDEADWARFRAEERPELVSVAERYGIQPMYHLELGYLINKGEMEYALQNDVSIEQLDFPRGKPRPSAQDSKDIRDQQRRISEWAQSQQKTLLLVHSMSFPNEMLQGIVGIKLYDMRILAQILEAADPNVNVIFVTAKEVGREVISHLLRSRPDRDQILKRVHFVTLDQGGSEPLAYKLLQHKNRGKLEEIRALMNIKRTPGPNLLVPFVSTPLEWKLAEALGIKNAVYGPHPSLLYWTGKSGNRRVFRKAGVLFADGKEDLFSVDEVAKAIDAIWQKNKHLKRVVVKINLGTSGMGNAILKLPIQASVMNGPGSFLTRTTLSLPQKQRIEIIRQALAGMRFYGGQDWPAYQRQIETFGAVAEAFVEGIKYSPSVQFEIRSDGSVWILSTHEQVLKDGTIYVGAEFPAREMYREQLQEMGKAVGRELSKLGVRGRVAVDAMVVERQGPTGPEHDVYATEINIRSGGTTHPYITVKLLTGAKYDVGSGTLKRADDGTRLDYRAIDHDVRPNLVGVNERDFLAYFERQDGQNSSVLFNGREGVVFHLIPAVELKGNAGYTIIVQNRNGAAQDNRRIMEYQRKLTRLLDKLEVEVMTGARHPSTDEPLSSEGTLVQPGVVGAEQQYWYIERDFRHQIHGVDQSVMEHEFKVFLQGHSDILYNQKTREGVVFHPAGYTVVAANQRDFLRIQSKVARFFEKFHEGHGAVLSPR